MDSPIRGHGTWPKDVAGYRLKGAELLGQEVPLATQLRHEDMWIPAHSHLWGAWVWSGLLGGLFWIYVLVFLIRFLGRGPSVLSHYLALSVFLSLLLIWSVLFSPFGGRPVKAAHLVFLVLIAEQAGASQPGTQERKPSMPPKRRRRGRRSQTEDVGQ